MNTRTLFIFLSGGFFLLPKADALDPITAPVWLTEAPEIPLPIPGSFLTPHAHLRVATGQSSAEHLDELATGGHDPNEESFNLQGLEIGASLEFGEYLQGFVTNNIFLDSDDDFDSELEEAFFKLQGLPSDISFRGGRFLNRFGLINAKHLHSRDFVDENLPNARFLGPEGLVTEGGEFSIGLPTPHPTFLTFSYGDAPAHDHDHGGGDSHDDHDDDHDEHEDEHDDHGDEHDDHDEHGEESAIDAHLFGGDLFTAALVTEYPHNDFHRWRSSFAVAKGDNVEGEDTEVFTLGLAYEWRENGHEAGGRHFRWSTELFLRDIDAHKEHHHEDDDHSPKSEDDHEEGHDDDHDDDHDEDHDDDHSEDHDEDDHDEEHHEGHASGDEFGLSTSLVYGMNESFEAALRCDYVEGISERGLDSRWRLSPALTWRPKSLPFSQARLQYNYDHLEDDGEEHTLWLQFGIDFGGNEIR